MRKQVSLVLSLGLLSLSAQAEPPVFSSLFSLTVMEKGVERKVDPKETLPAGARVRLHVEAKEQPCTIVTTGYQAGNAQEIPAVVPQVFSLQPSEEAASEFRLRQPLKAGELFVVVLPQHSGLTRELTQLIDSWKTKPEARLAIHERLSHWISKQDKDAQLPYPSSRAITIGGELPSELYNWHSEADGLRFSAEQPRVFVYRLGSKT